jgi:hypothetical protein
MRQLWIAQIRRRTMKLSQMQIAAQAELVARIYNSKWSAHVRVGAHFLTQVVPRVRRAMFDLLFLGSSNS